MVHIKAVNLRNFRSYKVLNMGAQDELHPGLNVIVGHNGSGKSNFLTAIELIINENFRTLNHEQKNNLIHTGTGEVLIAAAVELVLDNSDSSFIAPALAKGTRPTSDTETVRRTVGTRKDEYRVNAKPVTAQEISSTLISAGINSPNPYNIVQQGKIQQLATMNGFQIVQLLKSAAGAERYDERREQCLSKLEESTKNLDKVTEVVSTLDKELAKLEGQRKELDEWVRLDGERRAVEFVQLSHQLQEVKRKAGDVKDTDDFSIVKLETDIKETKGRIKKLEKEVSTSEAVQKQTIQRTEALEEQRRAMLARQLSLNIQLKDITRKDNEKVMKQLKEELKNLDQEIEEQEGILNAQKGSFEKANKAAEEAHKQYAKLKARLDELHAKRGRGLQFKTKPERDAWISGEIKKHETSIAELLAKQSSLEKDLKTLNENISKYSNGVGDGNSQLKKHMHDLTALETERTRCVSQREKAIEQRRANWKRIHDLEKQLHVQNEDFDRIDKKYQKAIPKEIKQGLDSLAELLKEQESLRKGYYGTLIELIQVEPAYRTAVETTAGNSLFNVVVATDHDAERILGAFNSAKKEGRLTFIPLNRLQREVKEVKHKDAILLLDKVKIDSRFAEAAKEFFWNTVVIRDLSMARQIIADHGCDCITLDGDQVNRKGAMRGGYIDTSVSKIQLSAQRWEGKDKIDKIKAEIDRVKKEGKSVEEEVEQIQQSLQELDVQSQKIKSGIDQARLELREATECRKLQEVEFSEKGKSAEIMKISITEYESMVRNLKEEKKTELKSKLTKEEDLELTTGEAQITDLAQASSDAKVKAVEQETQYKKVQILLNDDLYKRRSEINAQLARLQMDTSPVEINRLEQEQEQIEANIITFDNEITALRERDTNANTQLLELEQLKDKLTDLQSKKDTVRSEIEMQIGNKNQWEAQISEISNRIRALGTIPSQAKQYAELTAGELDKKMNAVVVKLRGHQHINRRAGDQYLKLVETRKDLKKKLDEMNHARKEIDTMLEEVDSQKEELIEYTFQQVKEAFRSVFKRLVGTKGQGDLILEKREVKKGKIVREDSMDIGEDIFKAVHIVVDFGTGGGKVAHTSELLSGGQKSLVALALILALQEVDPHPIYLFDEVDAAMDPQYRAAVAQCLKDMSKKNQLICTTFKPELVHLADRIYGVQFRDQMSRMAIVDERQALRILDKTQEGNVSEDESLAAPSSASRSSR